MEQLLSDNTLREAIVAAVYAVAATMTLAASMFVAYAARVLRKWKRSDE